MVRWTREGLAGKRVQVQAGGDMNLENLKNLKNYKNCPR